MTGATAALAHDLVAEPPAATLEPARRAVLDWLGVTLAGAEHPTARMLCAVALGLGVADEATVFRKARAAAAVAALANGAAAHVLELDDLHGPSTLHPGAPIIAAALAVAQREHATGRRFLRAVAVGYEAALRIGTAVNPSHYRYWHPTGTVATFGAAAAAASLLGLDAEGMRNALGNAGTQAAGLWEFNADGAMSKPLHAGKAAMNGVLAADLAVRGLSGAARILEGERGFFAAMSAHPNLGALAAGSAWRIAENGFKLYPCCGHTHTAIDAALRLFPQVRGKIGKIEIETYGPGFEIVKAMRPQTPSQAQFSLAFVTAVALLRGSVGLEHFSAAAVADAEVRELLHRTEVRVADDLTEQYPAAWPARLRVELEDGETLDAAVTIPHGQPGNPASNATLEAKFRGLATPVIGAVPAEAAIAAVAALGELRDMANFGVA